MATAFRLNPKEIDSVPAGTHADGNNLCLIVTSTGARERQRRKTGKKVEGRKSYAEQKPEMVKLAKELRAEEPSLRKISSALFAAGYKTPNGLRYSASAVASMLR